MAIVDVSKIPNNSKFDPVREAILELEGNIVSGIAGVASINGQTGSVNLVAGENIAINAANGAITISSTGGGGGEYTAGAGILVDNNELTISHSDTSSVANVTLSNGNVVNSITFDTFGHVQTVGSTDLDARYLAFRTIRTNNDNQETTATLYNDVVEFEGSASISVTKSPVSNEIRFGLSLSDVRFQDGKRVARGFLYYQGGAANNVWSTTADTWSTSANFWGIQEPTAADAPTSSTFDFTSNTININDPNWAETPPTTGYAFTTYYVVRYTSIDEGGTGEDARPVTYGDVTDAVGFEGPVTFNSLAEELGANGLTIIDGGRIRTGIITSVGVSRVGIDAGTSVYTENGSYFDLSTGDIATTEFSVLDGQGYFKGSLFIGNVELNSNNTLNENTTINDVSGLGILAGLDSIDSTFVTDLGDLATQNVVSTAQVSGLGAIAILNQIDATNTSQIAGLGSLALASVVQTNQIIGLGGLATQNVVDAATEVVGLGGLAFVSSVDAQEDVLNLGTLALLSEIDLSYITNAGAMAAIDQINSGNALTYIGNGAIVTNLIAAQAVTAEKIAVEQLAASQAFLDELFANNVLAVDGTFLGTLSVSNVNISDNVISIGATSNYSSKGTVRFTDGSGIERASISTQLTQIGPLTVAELLIDSNFSLNIDSPLLKLGKNSLGNTIGFDLQGPSVINTGVADYQYLVGGILVQWVRATFSGFQQDDGLWPISFPTTCLGAVVSKGNPSDAYNTQNETPNVSYTNTRWYVDLNNNTGATFFIIAFGY